MRELIAFVLFAVHYTSTAVPCDVDAILQQGEPYSAIVNTGKLPLTIYPILSSTNINYTYTNVSSALDLYSQVMVSTFSTVYC